MSMEWERLSVSMYSGNQFKEVKSSGEKVGWNVVSKERRQTFMPVSHPITNAAKGGGQVYCCANCARQAGVSAVVPGWRRFAGN
jgi:hypothetical protein